MSEELELKAASDIERILIGGDLSKLNAEQRILYYKSVCERVGLDPITKPFDYLQLSGKLVLYANKNATEQLRRVYGVSVYKVERDKTEDTYAVTAYGRNSEGREDAALGVVSIAGLKGDMLANAMMKAETKAKRRLTLSMCGLGMLDETEVETIPGAVKVDVEQPANPLMPTVNAETQAGFLKDFSERAEKASDFYQLASWSRQNMGIARKLDAHDEYLDIKVKNYLRLLGNEDGEQICLAPLVAIPAGVEREYELEFAAMDAAAVKNSDLKVVWDELRPVLQAAGLDKQWKEYGAALKKEVARLKEAQ